MQRKADTWMADPDPAHWPTVWRHKSWFVQWHPATMLTALFLWVCIGYLTTGHPKSELLAHDLSRTFAMMAMLLGGVVSLGQALSLGHFVVPKSLRKTAPSIGLVELPCTIGFIILLRLLTS